LERIAGIGRVVRTDQAGKTGKADDERCGKDRRCQDELI
jgi:hypothetical protein